MTLDWGCVTITKTADLKAEKRRRKTCFTCKTNFYRIAHIRLKILRKHGRHLLFDTIYVLGRRSQARKEVIFYKSKHFYSPCFPFPRVLNLHLINTNFLVHSRYEQAVEDPFHISKACLEPTSVKDGKNSITSVYIEVDDEEFLLCNLSDKVLNESLDLNFNTGDKLVFKTSVSILISTEFPF